MNHLLLHRVYHLRRHITPRLCLLLPSHHRPRLSKPSMVTGGVWSVMCKQLKLTAKVSRREIMNPSKSSMTEILQDVGIMISLMLPGGRTIVGICTHMVALVKINFGVSIVGAHQNWNTVFVSPRLMHLLRVLRVAPGYPLVPKTHRSHRFCPGHRTSLPRPPVPPCCSQTVFLMPSRSLRS